METKKCITCKQEKPATKEFFYKNAENKKGLFNECRVCMNKKSVERQRVKRAERDMFI